LLSKLPLIENVKKGDQKDINDASFCGKRREKKNAEKREKRMKKTKK